MTNYSIVLSSDERFTRHLVWLTSDSLIDCLQDIEKDLTGESGTILIDQLLITGNGRNRFFSCKYVDGKFVPKSAELVEPTKEICQRSVEILHKHYNLLKYSILTNTQREQVMSCCAF